MTNEAKNPIDATTKMQTVKAACDKAAPGPKKEAAMKHYQAAEKAHTAKNESDAIRELDKATHALS